MEPLSVTDVGALPSEGSLSVEFDRAIFTGTKPVELHRRHMGSSVVAPESMPEQLWKLCCDLLNAMGALYVIVEPRDLVIGVTAPADENSTGLLEATDFLLEVLARFADTAPEQPSLMDTSISLLSPGPEQASWQTVRRQMLDLLCERTRAALNAALASYKII